MTLSTPALDRPGLVEFILGILAETLDLEGEAAAALDPDTTLLGEEAIVTSIELVSVVADVEMLLFDDHGLEVTLVSEDALSRTRSPFRSPAALADYVLELIADPPPLDPAENR